LKVKKVEPYRLGQELIWPCKSLRPRYSHLANMSLMLALPPQLSGDCLLLFCCFSAGVAAAVATEMVLKMPVVLAKHEKLLDSFRTGLGLSFDDTGIDHCEMHRHAVSIRHNCFVWEVGLP
jgi:hypothetical protein